MTKYVIKKEDGEFLKSGDKILSFETHNEALEYIYLMGMDSSILDIEPWSRK